MFPRDGCFLMTRGHSGVCFVTPGNLEWLDKSKSRCLVMWRRPEEWAKLMYQWVRLLSVQVPFALGLDPGALWARAPSLVVLPDGVMLSSLQVSRNGMVNSVFTLYELSNGDETEGEGAPRPLHVSRFNACLPAGGCKCEAPCRRSSM